MPIPLADPQLVHAAAAAAFIFGLAFGSFLNVVIYRLPNDRSIVHPGSACPRCGHAIRFYDNIPVLSWFILRGKCRDCRAPIAPRYWMIESLTALLFAAVVLRYGITFFAARILVLVFLLIALIFIDADVHLLPDRLTYPGLLFGLLSSPLVALDGSSIFLLVTTGLYRPGLSWHWLSLADALLGAAIGSGLLFIVGEVYLKLRGREGMGLGDVKLMAMVGSFVGAQMTLMAIFLATLAGSLFGISALLLIYRKRLSRWKTRKIEPVLQGRRAWHSALIAYQRLEIPFGVFLGGATLSLLVLGDRFSAWLWRFSR